MHQGQDNAVTFPTRVAARCTHIEDALPRHVTVTYGAFWVFQKVLSIFKRLTAPFLEKTQRNHGSKRISAIEVQAFFVLIDWRKCWNLKKYDPNSKIWKNEEKNQPESQDVFIQNGKKPSYMCSYIMARSPRRCVHTVWQETLRLVDVFIHNSKKPS